MLAVLEIILTIIAWKRGWRWWALLPFGLTITLDFIAGIISYFVGGPEEMSPGIELLVDVLIIGALAIMIAFPRRYKGPARDIDQYIQKENGGVSSAPGLGKDYRV